jgi:hypothetical protein
MKNLIFGLLLAVSFVGAAAAQQRVDGFTRRDSTYVELLPIDPEQFL